MGAGESSGRRYPPPDCWLIIHRTKKEGREKVSIEVSTQSKVSTGNLSGNIEKPLSKKLPGGGKSQIQRPVKTKREQAPNPNDYGLSDQQAIFAEAVVSDMTRIAAYAKANYKCAGNAAYVGASQVLRNIKVSRYIHAIRNRYQSRYQIELNADPEGSKLAGGSPFR